MHRTKEYNFKFPDDVKKPKIIGRWSKSYEAPTFQGAKADIVYCEPLLSHKHASISIKRKDKQSGAEAPLPRPHELMITIRSCKAIDNLVDVTQNVLKHKLVIENGGRFGLIGVPTPDGKIKPLFKIQVNIYLEDSRSGLYQVVLRDISRDYLPFPGVSPVGSSQTVLNKTTRHLQTPERSLVIVNFKKHNKNSKHHRKPHHNLKIKRSTTRRQSPSVTPVLMGTLLGTLLGSVGILGAIIYFGDQLESLL